MQKSYEGGKAEPDILYMERLQELSGIIAGRWRRGPIPRLEFVNQSLNLPKVEKGEAKATGNGQPDDLPTLLTQLMQKQNQLMEMQNKILAEQKESIVEKVKEIHAETKEIHVNSKSTIAYLQTILRVNRADDAVIMDNQDELAGREIGSSAMQAGNLEIAAAKHQQQKDRKRKDGAHK
jgi:hypothetical protein